MSFDSTYREELAFLREMGREMALAHPGSCDALAQPGTDPDVERLLEGFAFLAARTRERADDAIPEAIEGIAEVVAPYALRPIPGSTVMELSPRAVLARDRVTVPAGAAFGARSELGVRCELRSTANVELMPLAIERTTIDRRPAAPELVIALRAPRAGLDAVYGAASIRFFVHAPIAVASSLALAIDRRLTRVSVRHGTTETVLGRAAMLVDPDREPHLPWPEHTPDAARHLLELAYFPERHSFFDVVGLSRVDSLARTERFELRLRFDAGATLPEPLAEDALRLHCVPAINLFPCDAEPIRWRDDLRDVLLRAAGAPPAAIEVYDVDSVVGLAEGARERRTYRSYASFDHLREQARHGFFALRRVRSPLDGAVDTHLRVGRRASSAAETLSITMRCTNRAAAAALRAGDVRDAVQGSPSIATFTNLIPLGPRASAPVGSEALHALVGARGLGHHARLEASAMRSWLAAHAVGAGSDLARARVCASLTDAIRAVRHRPYRAARRGVIERGVHVELEIDEARAPSPGEVFLFSRALDRALAAELPLGVRHRLVSTLVPSRATIELDPRGAPESR